jgi:CheY-like chemotaxis protein
VWNKVLEIHKALIVDDNENNRLILRQMLKLKNIEVEEAANGFEALQLLARQNTYDVILMDYHMPYMDGLETIRKIRESFIPFPERLPLVLLHSSSDDEKIQHACEELAINQRLVKPVKMEELYGSLYRLNKFSPTDIENDNVESEPFKINAKALTILVVEDNIINKLLAKTIINRIAPEALLLEAQNGQEALAIYDKADLILMDIQMPIMNGYEATKAIRDMEKPGRRVPIIALTAGNVKGEKEKCLEVGMDDFVAKPFVEETIIRLFKAWLDPALHENDGSQQKVQPARENHFDLEVLKSYVGDDEMIIVEVLMLTKQELQKSLSSIRLLENQNNIPQIKESGHKLVGTAVGVGLETLADLARQLEHLELDDADAVPDLVKKLACEIKICGQLIDEYLAIRH